MSDPVTSEEITRQQEARFADLVKELRAQMLEICPPHNFKVVNTYQTLWKMYCCKCGENRCI